MRKATTKKWHILGYETCINSKKRKNAPWRVHDSCPNRARLFAEGHYALPNKSVCMTCPYYCQDRNVPSNEGQNG